MKKNNRGLKIYVKASNFALKVNFPIFKKKKKKNKKKKNPGNITLNPLQTAPVFTVEFGFTRYKIWFSITLFPKDFKNQAPVTKISDVFDFA